MANCWHRVVSLDDTFGLFPEIAVVAGVMRANSSRITILEVTGA